MNTLARITAVCAMFTAPSAAAVTIDISYPDAEVVRVLLADIEAVEDRVYTLTTDADGTAGLIFGDGIAGARPASGGGVVASYRYGSGIDGGIVEEYPVFAPQFPLIPRADFGDIGGKEPGASFVLAGLAAIGFDFYIDGLRVISAAPLPAAVPAPTALLLFGTALAGLGALCRRRENSPPRRGSR